MINYSILFFCVKGYTFLETYINTHAQYTHFRRFPVLNNTVVLFIRVAQGDIIVYVTKKYKEPSKRTFWPTIGNPQHIKNKQEEKEGKFVLRDVFHTIHE